MFACRITVLCFAALGCRSQAVDRPPLVNLPLNGTFSDRGSLRVEFGKHGDELSFAPGVQGDALFVGGTRDWIDARLPATMRFDSGGTIELWARRDQWVNPYRAGSSAQTILSLDPFIIDLNVLRSLDPDHNRIRGYARLARGEIRMQSDYILPANTWVHLALVYGDRTVTLYVNGQRAERERRISGLADRYDNPLRIGTWHEANQAFRGWIDEVKVYDYARSPEQIRASLPQKLIVLPMAGRGFSERFHLREILLAVIVLIGLAIARSGVRDLSKGRASAQWPRAAGRVVSSKMSRSTDDDGDTSYETTVHYNYDVGGVRYESTRISFADHVHSSTRRWAEAVLQRYPAGKEVMPHYNRDNPAEAVLEPLAVRRLYPLIAFGLLLTAVASYFLWRSGV